MRIGSGFKRNGVRDAGERAVYRMLCLLVSQLRNAEHKGGAHVACCGVQHAADKVCTSHEHQPMIRYANSCDLCVLRSCYACVCVCVCVVCVLCAWLCRSCSCTSSGLCLTARRHTRPQRELNSLSRSRLKSSIPRCCTLNLGFERFVRFLRFLRLRVLGFGVCSLQTGRTFVCVYVAARTCMVVACTNTRDGSPTPYIS